MWTCPQCDAQFEDSRKRCPFCNHERTVEPSAGAPPVLSAERTFPPPPPFLPPKNLPVIPKTARPSPWQSPLAGAVVAVGLLALILVGVILSHRQARRPKPLSPSPPVQVTPNRPTTSRPANTSSINTQWVMMTPQQKTNYLNLLIARLKSEDATQRRSAAVSLGVIGREAREAVPHLQLLLEDDAAQVRLVAAYALGQMGYAAEPAVPALVKLLADPDEQVPPYAATALKKIRPEGGPEYDRYVQTQMEAQVEKGTATGTVYNNLAWHYVQHKVKPAETLAYARKAVELEPDKSFIRDTLGWAFLRNGQYEEALQTFADLFDRFPFEAQGAASSWRGVMEIAQSPVKDEVLLAFCEKLARGTGARTLVRLHAVQAEFHRRRGNPEQARNHWRQTGFLAESGWQFVGPFDSIRGEGFHKMFVPEGILPPLAQPEYPGQRGPCRWEARQDTVPDGHIDFQQIFSGATDWAAAYAYRTFQVPADSAGQLRIGSDDQVKVWLNGKLVSEVSQPRTTDLDQEIVPVNFQAGTNHLLVKVCNTTLSWGFYLRLTDRNGQPVEGLKDD